MRVNTQRVHAAPIDPPEGYPKFNTSTKTVTPTLAETGGMTLTYWVEIRNTGAYQGVGTIMRDAIPVGTTYNDDAQASEVGDFTYADGLLTWVGDVGFDSTIVISFSVTTAPDLIGKVRNTAVISQAMISEPVSVTAETTITDQPIFSITKTSTPVKPGAEKRLYYDLALTNYGQSAVNTLITVTDRIPDNTNSPQVGQGGSFDGSEVSWTQPVTLELGVTTHFTFSVMVDSVPSGTILTNDQYQVDAGEFGIFAGEVHTTTVIDPILSLSKNVYPDPPGSNREMTYTLRVFNQGSQATDLEVTDGLPENVDYQRGGTVEGDVVSWTIPELDTGESALVSYTVFVDDVIDLNLVNDDYEVCSAEGVCAPGEVITSLVHGPSFKIDVSLDPIAKKPGGGGGPVTPTLVVENLGPGSALLADAQILFERISVSAEDLYAYDDYGNTIPFTDALDCGEKCVYFLWSGNLGAGETITFTTDVGQSTIGGEEGTNYTATLVISDTLINGATEPFTGTASGRITHFANLEVYKSAPAVIGRGQLMTYTLNVWNSGLSTDVPPYPILSDTIPTSVTLVSVSDDGASQEVGDATVVSWTLPALSTGERLGRAFSVRVDDDLVSGTKLVNDEYGVTWLDVYSDTSEFTFNRGDPVTTTVKEVGLIDSYKEVEPRLALPGKDIVLTYTLHVVNSSPVSLQDVQVYDTLPWQHSTYQRDVIASAGAVVSDIVSVEWEGDLDAYSSVTMTLSVLVDAYYEGPLTNTAVIDHPSLLEPVVVDAVAYITDDPVLHIWKKASPDPVKRGEELLYTLNVENLGQQATGLVITDTIPDNTTYVQGSASSGGTFQNNQIQWESSVLDALEKQTFSFRVSADSGPEIINQYYGVKSVGGFVAIGEPLVTKVSGGGMIYLPLIVR
jgi:uncharacterized repeat protein (TIGR01451 family)